MRRKVALVATASMVLGTLLWAVRGFASPAAPAGEADRGAKEVTEAKVVRIAELTIDPAQLQQYKAALQGEIQASIRLEPGVLALYAVSVKNEPAQVRLFEFYADQAAYQAHLQTPHFLKYKASTAGMVKSLRLIETDPILLGAKRH